MNVERGLTRLSWVILAVGITVFLFCAWHISILYPMRGNDFVDGRLFDLARNGLAALTISLCLWWILRGFIGK